MTAEAKALRDHLLELLEGKEAHTSFQSAVKDLPPELRGKLPPGAPHTAWQLLEHLRIAQSDILEFTRDATHVSPKWPEGYWPKTAAPPAVAAWDKSVAAFERDAQEFKDLVRNPPAPLTAPLPHGQGQTILREALLVADHNSYHLGQLIMLRKMLGAWKG